MNPFGRFFRHTTLANLVAGWLLGSVAQAELQPPGFRPLPPDVHALVGGKVVVRPGEVLDSGTIIIRGGLIGAVGKAVPVPADARVWDAKGMTIYAGFIEPYLLLNATNPPLSTADVVPISSRSLAAGGFRFYGAPGARIDMGRPGPGYGLAGVTPQFRAVESYSPKDETLSPLRELGFTAVNVAPVKGLLRGRSALVTLSDDNPNTTVIKPEVFQHVAFESGQDDSASYPGSLMGSIAAVRQSFFDATHYRLDQADYEQRPQGRKRPDFDPALAALAPALDRTMPVMFEPGSVLMDDRAARVAREIGLDFCLVSCGQEWRRPDLARATGATFIVPVNFPALPKLPDDADWEQVSLDALRAWDWAPENPAVLRQQGLDIALTTHGLSDKKDFRKNLRRALDRGLSERDALAALTTVPARLCGVADRLGTIEPGKLAHLTVVEGNSYFDPDAKVRAVWIDGRIWPAPPEASKPESSGTNTPAQRNSATKQDKQDERMRELQRTRVARPPGEGRGPIAVPSALLIRNATVWTCGPKGIMTNASVWVTNGKIKGVGRVESNLDPKGLAMDGTGLTVTPGIIDCHSHTAILGDVNEAALPSTAMVRIRDVVNSETEHLYEQLAGGVTTINVLHGSANPIGGQNCVIKLRDGATPEGLIFSNAPPGIKFALGENVKQSNWGEKFVTRFPQTRMGVRAFIENRFVAAQDYLRKWAGYSNQLTRVSQPRNRAAAGFSAPLPPRRDLELEALGEVLQGRRWIHCHAYRQDEILMLLRLMQDFGVQIGTFQHVLEGYKVADELAAGNVGASAFSDWWAYKFEVYDAIPYNGSLMRDRGVLTSFNSDSSELARRLYLEAAKAVKYGGTSEFEALNLITLNPARQLRIDPWVGSLEPGKDADLAIWSKSPLDAGTVCLQTWIEGKKYFDRSLDTERVARLKQEREDLLAKARKVAKLSGEEKDKPGEEGRDAFFRVSLEHEFDRVDRGCLKGEEGER